MLEVEVVALRQQPCRGLAECSSGRGRGVVFVESFEHIPSRLHGCCCILVILVCNLPCSVLIISHSLCLGKCFLGLLVLSLKLLDGLFTLLNHRCEFGDF